MGRKRKRKRDDEQRTSDKPFTPKVGEAIEEWAVEAAEAHGFDLWDVEVVRHGRWTIRVFIDHPEAEPGEGINVDECAEVSRYIEAIMDADDRIPEVYVLEVSSPGVERPLKKSKHFDRVVGDDVQIVVREPVAGKNKVVGRLVDHRDGRLVVEIDDEQFEVDRDDVARAKLKFDFSNQKSGEQ